METKDTQPDEEQDGMKLVEIEPGIWGYIGEHAEPGSKDYENTSNSGYWIVSNG